MSDKVDTRPERLLAYVQKTAEKGVPSSVLAAVEDFNQQGEWMMHVGVKKRMKMEEIVQEAVPKTCLELGAYCGYSATAVARHLQPGSRLITVEREERIADIARQLIQFAGLSEVITVVTGTSEDLIHSLRSKHSVDKLDFVFIDHTKEFYLSDLKLLEANQHLREGTVVMADNILYPGAPDYLEYVESCSKYKTEQFRVKLEGMDGDDIMTISVYSDSK